MKLDTKKLETFEWSRVFDDVVKATLNNNLADINVDRVALHTDRQPQMKEMFSVILK